MATKPAPVLVYIEQARIRNVPQSVTRTEVILPGRAAAIARNSVYAMASNKAMGESFLRELYRAVSTLEPAKGHGDIMVYSSDEHAGENYNTFLEVQKSGEKVPVHNYRDCMRLSNLCKAKGYHILFGQSGLMTGAVKNAAAQALTTYLSQQMANHKKEGA